MALLRLVPICVMALGCQTSVVSALSARSTSAAATDDSDTTIEVRVDATSARLPLAVAGSNIVFTDVDRALDQSIRAAFAALSSTGTRDARPLELFAEVIEAQAEHTGDRLVVHMIVRATLREKPGNTYLAQTHARSSASGALGPDHGAALVRSCTDSIGGHLAGWIAGLNL
jgi:hypothetical protein